MRDYELQVQLTKKEPLGLAEWHESTVVQAKNLADAKKMAKAFAIEMASAQQAKIEDYYAIDDETGEYSD